MLQAIEIAQKRLPFRHNASLARQVFQALLHGEREERTKYVAPYRGVGGMEDRRSARPWHRVERRQTPSAGDPVSWQLPLPLGVLLGRLAIGTVGGRIADCCHGIGRSWRLLRRAASQGRR